MKSILSSSIKNLLQSSDRVISDRVILASLEGQRDLFRSEVLEHHKKLVNLKELGEHIQSSNPSLESANKFSQFVSSSIAELNGNKPLPSLEMNLTPEEKIAASLESVSALITAIKTLFKKKPTEEEKKAIETTRKTEYETSLKFVKALGDKSWLEKAVLRDGPISIPKTSSSFFHRGAIGFTTPSKLIAEIKKDINQYKTINDKIYKSYKAYSKWAEETWKGSEKVWTANKNNDDGEIATAIEIYLLDQHKKQPSIGDITFNKMVNLGFSNDDWSIKNGKTSINQTPDQSDSLEMEALTISDIRELYELTLDIFELSYEIEEKSFSNVEGFDDYPWRADPMQKGLSAAIRKESSSGNFDVHFLYDNFEGVMLNIGTRLDKLSEAIMDYLKAGIQSRP